MRRTADLTRVEAALDAWAHRHLAEEFGARGARRVWVEFLVFTLKQAWASRSEEFKGPKGRDSKAAGQHSESV